MLPDTIAGGGAVTQMSKLYKWKKINYKTFLPKHAPVVVYIVAKANTFERHHQPSSSGLQRQIGGGVGGQSSSHLSSSLNGNGNSQLPQKHFMMHAAAHAREFDRRYTMSDVSR